MEGITHSNSPNKTKQCNLKYGSQSWKSLPQQPPEQCTNKCVCE